QGKSVKYEVVTNYSDLIALVSGA
ncbi:MAG: hypothetical protein JWN99_1002, partial [Ilumatobacteraceae bacterium]|nr:hypothetical protein [Ilumatobacteraceae bacterium]